MENKKQQENAKVMVNELNDQQLDTVNGGGFLTDLFNNVKDVGKQALHGPGLAAVNDAYDKVTELLGPKQ